MKQILVYLILTISCSSFSQDTIFVTSIDHAQVEAERGKYIRLFIEEDTSEVLPERLFSIPKDKLVWLNIDNCHYEVITQRISEFTNLEFFRYSWFYMSDCSLKRFPDFIPLSTQIETVIIEGVYFDSIPSLERLVNVKRWEFYGCHLKTFPLEILSLSNLEDLTLACDDYVEIPDGIDRLTKLKSIEFGGGACGYTPIRIIPNSLANLKHLEKFSSQYQSIGKLEMSSFFEELPIRN